MLNYRGIADLIRNHNARLVAERLVEASRLPADNADHLDMEEEFSIRRLWEGLLGPVGATLEGKQTLQLLEARSGEAFREAADGVSAFSTITGEVIRARLIRAYADPAYVWPQLCREEYYRHRDVKIAGLEGEEGPDEILPGMPYPRKGIGREIYATAEQIKKGYIKEIDEDLIIEDRTGQLLSWATKRGRKMGIDKDRRVVEDLHDRHRRFTPSAGSYSKVRQALQEISRRPGLAGHTTLRATFLPGQGCIERRLEHLNDLCDLGCARGVSVEPAVVSESSCPIDSAEFAPGELARAILQGARWCVDRARGGKRARFHLLEVTLRRLFFRRPAPSDCAAGWGYVAVAPSGDVFACHKEAGGPIGHVRYGFDEEARTPWRENRWYARSKCRRCWARNLCGGGCRAQAPCFSRPAGISCELGRARSLAAIEVLASLADEPEVLTRLVPAGKAKACASDS